MPTTNEWARELGQGIASHYVRPMWDSPTRLQHLKSLVGNDGMVFLTLYGAVQVIMRRARHAPEEAIKGLVQVLGWREDFWRSADSYNRLFPDFEKILALYCRNHSIPYVNDWEKYVLAILDLAAFTIGLTEMVDAARPSVWRKLGDLFS